MYRTHKYLTVFFMVFGFCLLFYLELGGQIVSKEQRNFKDGLILKVKEQSNGLLGSIASDQSKYLEDYFQKSGRIEKIGKEALLLSILFNSTSCLKTLVNSGMSLDDFSKEGNLLIHAIDNNSVEVFEELAAMGANKYPQLDKGYTLLHYATSIGRSEMINAIIDQGFEIDQTEEVNGSTSLHLAIQNGFNDCLWVLLNRQAKTDIFDNSGKLPIHIACRKGNLKGLSTLMGFGADLLIPDSNDYLPIHIAIEEQNKELVDFLLNFIPSLDNVSSNLNSYKFAKKAGNKEILKMIDERKDAEKKFYAYANIVPPTCKENCTGYIAINPQKGKAPYSFKWDTGISESNSADNLCSDTYRILVSDSKKKTYLLDIPLLMVNGMDLEHEKIDLASWNGLELINSKVSGGIPPLQFFWNEEKGSRSKTLKSGDYTLEIKDHQGCAVSTDLKVKVKEDTSLKKKLLEEEKKQKEEAIKQASLEKESSQIEMSTETSNENYSISEEINFEMPSNDLLDLFEDHQVNVVIQSKRGTELGRYTIADYLDRLNLLKKYEPTVVDTRKNDAGKIVLVKVYEKSK